MLTHSIHSAAKVMLKLDANTENLRKYQNLHADTENACSRHKIMPRPPPSKQEQLVTFSACQQRHAYKPSMISWIFRCRGAEASYLIALMPPPAVIVDTPLLSD